MTTKRENSYTEKESSEFDDHIIWIPSPQLVQALMQNPLNEHFHISPFGDTPANITIRTQLPYVEINLTIEKVLEKSFPTTKSNWVPLTNATSFDNSFPDIK